MEDLMPKSKQTTRISRIRLSIGIISFVLVFLVAGCSNIGPSTVARDRFDYVTAISESWKRQTLLNIIKTRYLDAPVFMDVSSVINSYTVEGNINLGVGWSDAALMGNTQTVGGSAKYSDRPTITYTPLLGERFTRSLMTPIPISGILFLLQAGYPADYVFRITVQTINGLRNSYGGSIATRGADQGFKELLTLLRAIQIKGGLGMRVRKVNEKESIIMFFRSATDKAIAKDMSRVRELLGLKADTREFTVAYGSFSEEDTEIALLSRSMLQILIDFGSYVEVPDSEVAEGRVSAGFQERITDDKILPLIQVKNEISEPDDAYVAVRYRDRWFYIDDRDIGSKRTFTFLMFLFSLTERGTGQQGAPVVTVPAG
jgi:hypothetical protein